MVAVPIRAAAQQCGVGDGITAARAPGLHRCVSTSALLVLAVPPQGLGAVRWVLVMAGLCSSMELLF